MPRFIDLFCGCGGASSGFESAGWTSVCGVDAAEGPLRTYAKNFPRAATICGDVGDDSLRARLRDAYRGGVDAVVGGPPCQGFSARNRTAHDERYERMNALPMAFARLAASLEPTYVVMEEVVSARAAVEEVADYLEAKGFAVWRAALNAADFGVPQSRRRVVLVASAPGAPRFVPPSPVRRVAAGEALARAPVPAAGRPVSEYARGKIVELQRSNRRPMGGNYTLLNLDKPAPTIHTQTNSATGPYTIRRGERYHTMSEAEAARLQSFPPEFEFVGASTSVRKQIGNAVPPLLARAVARGLPADGRG